MSQSGGLNYSKKNTPKNKPPPPKKNTKQTKISDKQN